MLPVIFFLVEKAVQIIQKASIHLVFSSLADSKHDLRVTLAIISIKRFHKNTLYNANQIGLAKAWFFKQF